jgi:hypothetical protein
MTADILVGELHQLAVHLRQYFHPQGNPPEMAEWLFTVDDERELDADSTAGESSLFSGLLNTNPEPSLAEAIANIPALQTMASLLRSIHSQIIVSYPTSRLAHLFRKLLKLPWVSHVVRSSVACYESHRIHRYGYTFHPIPSSAIDDILNAGIELAAQKIAIDANTHKMFPKGIPDNPDIRDLAIRLNSDKGSGKSQNQTAREFTGETLGSDTKAKRLLASLRMLKARGRYNP